MIINRLSPLVATSENLEKILLNNRQIKNSDTFFNPPYPQNHLDLSLVIKLIKEYSSKNILIYGDYDVDGITSTALLWQAIYPLCPQVYPFIPDRQRDGYGFKAESFFNIQSTKHLQFDLLITVDNGIVAQSEFAKIKQIQDTKILIIDHHLANGEVSADALVHSVDHSAAGLAYFVAQELSQNADIGLAALGTVADCLPLLEINRQLVVHGLEKLRNNPSCGIKKLIDVSGLNQNNLTVSDLSFGLAPRINAIGRLDNPLNALRLLCSSTDQQANQYASLLNDFNQSRQDIQKESTESALKTVDATQKIIVVSGQYHPGVIGLIASKLVEKYYLPSVVITSDGSVAKGSCRSIDGVNIISQLRKFQELFIDLGGHPGAAGFSIDPKNIDNLKTALQNEFLEVLKDYQPQPSVTVEAETTIDLVSETIYQKINQFAPFGIGNQHPQFLFKNLVINNLSLVGQTKDHLKLVLSKISSIAFKKGDLIENLKIGQKVDVVAQIDLNIWNNRSTPQLIVKEIISE
ncbi:MAG TPA: DHHA1 domain-containing protein [Candidatus Woesebacteria bacterium]|nr:DHHA1 domain-containing protein [Candidatus Woesebacteria bacterium]